jgi:hypothetical protein
MSLNDFYIYDKWNYEKIDIPAVLAKNEPPITI